MYKVEAAIFQPWVQGSREAMRQLAKDEDYVRIALLQDERGQRGAMEELLHALSKKVGDYVLDAAQQKRQVRQARSLVQEEQVERDYLLEAQAHRRAVLEQVVIKEAVTRVCLERCEANDCAALDLGNGRAFLLHLLEAQEEFLARVSAEETRKREALLTYERDARRHRHDCYIGERYEIRRRASSAHKATYMSGGRDPSGRRPMAVGLTPAAPVPRPSYFASPDSAAYNRQAAFTQRWKEGASTFMSRCPSASPQRARTPAFQPTPPRPDHRPASAQRARGKYGFSPRTPERPQSARAPPHDAFASASPQRAIPPPAIPDSSVEETVGHESSLDSSVKDSTASPCRRGSPAGEGKDEKEDAWQLVELNHDDAIVLLRGDNRGRDGILSSQKEAHADLMLAFRCEELQLLSARHKRPVYKTAEEDDHAADQARKLSAREYAQQVRDELQALETGAPAPPPSARPGSARPRPEAAAKPATAHDLNRHTSEDEAGMRHFMARRIQRSLRRYCAEKPRRDLAVYNAHRVADENDQDAKACAMQRAARGYIARKETGRRRSSTHEHVAQAIKEDKHRDESACTIQRAYRGAAAREKRQSLAEAVDSSNVTRRASEQSPAEATDEDDDTKAATKIQAVQRGRQARRESDEDPSCTAWPASAAGIGGEEGSACGGEAARGGCDKDSGRTARPASAAGIGGCDEDPSCTAWPASAAGIGGEEGSACGGEAARGGCDKDSGRTARPASAAGIGGEEGSACGGEAARGGRDEDPSCTAWPASAAGIGGEEGSGR
eukprot:TRINITY_DN1469_c0_g1_i1.p1 TRINITY_DN1469_c0_g1~~TRINITY_DN1469_c0_g1_i1.p1  ORF type:complete len:785 (+),score=187.32 TRINITY_DN1469_c0_g1_i1:147-2501(+)